jgi:NTP pyrophosphatase (non-canonical NTP hydrolase)
MSDFNQYQVNAGQFANYKDPAYPFLGLAEETGEVVSLVSKWMRKHGKVEWDQPFDLDTRKRLAGELGDVLWMVAECADQIGFDLSVIAELNLSKLTARHGERLPLIEVAELEEDNEPF